MRMTWRGLELPTRVERDDSVSTDSTASSSSSRFERGFGITVGNSLRRILLSSLEGSAVTPSRCTAPSTSSPPSPAWWKT